MSRCRSGVMVLLHDEGSGDPSSWSSTDQPKVMPGPPRSGLVQPVITLTNVACRFLQDLQDNVRGLSRRFSAEAHRSMEVAAK